MSARNLSDTQIAEARRLYDSGLTLGEIATAVGCGLYDLSPWLYMEHPTMRAAIAVAEQRVANEDAR